MTKASVYSIGHGGLSLDAFVQRLLMVSVRYIVDVRSSPYSRFQPEFGREFLTQFLRLKFANKGAGLRLGYVFMGDQLGGRPDHPECYTDDGRVDYVRTRAMPFFREGMARLHLARERGFNICMLCSEADPSQCHRTKMIGEALAAEGVETVHIAANGQLVRQADVMAQLRSRQSTMFEERELQMSRKAYR